MLSLLLLGALLSSDYAVVGALLASGDHVPAAEATRYYQAATEIAPSSALAWSRLATAYQRTQRYSAAAAASRTARSLLGFCLPAATIIHRDCWGNGGPCPPGTKPDLGDGISSACGPDLLRNAQILYRPSADGRAQRIEIRVEPEPNQR